ncbi:hypothetical protein Taro_042487, partial [Colocasia esculenta]|nr:hypothetical protein [Colocasia esculenta]
MELSFILAKENSSVFFHSMASLSFPAPSPLHPLPAGRRAALLPVPSVRHFRAHYRSEPHASSRGRRAAPRRDRGPFRLRGALPRNAAGHAVEVKQREPMVPPYNVLITGSTKGIGYAFAKEFLKAGDNVIICSRSDTKNDEYYAAEIFTHISRQQYAAERVELAVQNLRKEFGMQHGTVCDVREAKDVKALVAFVRDTVKYVDIWINNAGSNAYSYKPLAETSDEDLMEVVTTNTLGLMICCREAINMMLNQPRGGHIFNMDGAGSDGRPTPRFAAYGATKRSVVHLTKSLQAELQMQEVNNVVVHNLSPGMVTTDLLMSGANTKQAKFFINILAEPPEVVAEFLVRCIRVIPSKGSTKSTYIRFLTGLKAYSQIFSVKRTQSPFFPQARDILSIQRLQMANSFLFPFLFCIQRFAFGTRRNRQRWGYVRPYHTYAPLGRAGQERACDDATPFRLAHGGTARRPVAHLPSPFDDRSAPAIVTASSSAGDRRPFDSRTEEPRAVWSLISRPLPTTAPLCFDIVDCASGHRRYIVLR